MNPPLELILLCYIRGMESNLIKWQEPLFRKHLRPPTLLSERLQLHSISVSVANHFRSLAIQQLHSWIPVTLMMMMMMISTNPLREKQQHQCICRCIVVLLLLQDWLHISTRTFRFGSIMRSRELLVVHLHGLQQEILAKLRE